MIHLENINKIFPTKAGDLHALKDISLSVAEGEICGVIGRSGAGKSTLIRCVNLLERPTSGRVTVAGQDLLTLSKAQLREARHQIGMVFQHFNLLSSRTVYRNIAFQLELLGKSKAEINKAVEPLLEFTGLCDKRDMYPHQLSGGQKQRVAIARALATQPKVLLCDEMTSSLDPETTRSILHLVKEINREFGLSILLITHEMPVVKNISDHVAVIDGGCIVENTDVVSLFQEPQSEVAKQFVKGDLSEQVPEELHARLHKESVEGGKLLVQIAFIGKTATQPIINELLNHSKVNVNIMQANLEYLRSETIGVMTATFDGEHEACEEAILYLKEKGIGVEVLGYVA
jgi:D-methionine transport system ATP-binding protein